MPLALRRALPVLLLAVFACDTAAPPPQQAPPPVVRAQAPPPDEPAPGPDPDIQQTVARISLIAGNDVSFSRGDDPENWQPADLNVPMTLGDRVWTGDGGRIELQVHGGSVVRLAGRTDLQALNLTGSMKQFSLTLGTASFQVRRLADDEVFEVDTPNTAVTFERPGDYRVDVDDDGNTRVQVRRGRAMAAAGGGQVALSAGDEMDVDGTERPRYDIVAVPRPDGWDQWVAQRDQQLAQARSYTYVTADIAGVEDLDQYGRWQQIPEYGWTWSPISVEAGWAPYRAGPLDLAGPLGLDLGRGRAVGLGAVPLRTLGLCRGALVLGASGTARADRRVFARARGIRRRLGRIRRLVPARAARSVLSLVAPRPDRRRDQRDLRESDLRDGRQPDRLRLGPERFARPRARPRGDPDGGRDSRAARAGPCRPDARLDPDDRPHRGRGGPAARCDLCAGRRRARAPAGGAAALRRKGSRHPRKPRRARHDRGGREDVDAGPLTARRARASGCPCVRGRDAGSAQRCREGTPSRASRSGARSARGRRARGRTVAAGDRHAAPSGCSHRKANAAAARLSGPDRAPRRSEPAARAPGGAASDRAPGAATRGDAGTRGHRTRPGPATHAREASAGRAHRAGAETGGAARPTPKPTPTKKPSG